MKRALLSLALAAIMTLASAGISSASGTATRTPVPAQCPQFIGYVCLAQPNGDLVLIPAGETRVYPEGLPVVEISNGTTSLYCVLATPFNFSVAPRTVRTVSATVRAIGPTDGACLT